MIHTARVIPGRSDGRRLGFPTLNLEVPPGFGAKHGIYAGWAWLDPKEAGTAAARLPAAVHYGPVPAFGVATASLEAYLIDVDIPEPPREVGLELVQYLREVRDFNDIEALQRQIREDVQEALKVLQAAE